MTEPTFIPPAMPAPIAKAIVKIKQTVTMLGADDKNPHGGYKYVSVDKFYEVIGRKMASEGLALVIDETAAEVREGAKGNPWLFTQYSMSFVHESGVMSPPMRRSCALPISGPQAFGAAQSYIEKQFLRQVFKIPTGEKDADQIAQADLNEQVAANDTSDGYVKKVSTEEREALVKICDEISESAGQVTEIEKKAYQVKCLQSASKAFGISLASFAEVPASHYQRMVAALNEKRHAVAASAMAAK